MALKQGAHLNGNECFVIETRNFFGFIPKINMEALSDEFNKKIIIMNEFGLHARPAAMIAKLAQKARSSIWIIKDGNKVDASSIIDILSLACVKGTEIILQIENADDIEVIHDIVDLIENGAGDAT